MNIFAVNLIHSMEKKVIRTYHFGTKLGYLQVNKIENHINGKLAQKYMKDQVYGAEKGNGEKVVLWLKEQAKSTGLKLEVRLEDYIISTQNFGEFELISLSDDSISVRKLISKVGKRYGIKI